MFADHAEYQRSDEEILRQITDKVLKWNYRGQSCTI
jgi:hypothetical protein